MKDRWMLRTLPAFRGWVSALLCSGVFLLSGCSLSHMAKGEPGTDITPVKPGMTRAQAEAILGPSLRDMQIPSGVRYSVYRYNVGTQTERGWFLSNAFMDVMTLGSWEILHVISPNADRNHQQQLVGQLAISYDSSDVLLGVFRDFEDFDTLPPDGLQRAPVAEKTR